MDNIYASDDASDTSAAPPLQAMSDPPSSSTLSDDNPGPRLDDNSGPRSDDNSGPRSDDTYLESLARASSPLGDISTEELDFNPDGIFDTPGPTPPDTDDEETMEDLPQLDHDPLFEGSDALFERILDSGSDDLAPDTSSPPALDEDPVIRNAYITAYLLSACHGYTQEGIKAYLDSMHESFAALQRKGQLQLRGLDTMARTLLTVERRLRIDPNRYIVYYFLCTVCWARHYPSSLNDLDDESCTMPECPGFLYSLKELTGGHLKRTPLRVLPTAPGGATPDWLSWVIVCEGSGTSAGSIVYPASTENRVAFLGVSLDATGVGR